MKGVPDYKLSGVLDYGIHPACDILLFYPRFLSIVADAYDLILREGYKWVFPVNLS